jgi:hypothetical protein
MGEAQCANLQTVNAPEQNCEIIDETKALGRSFGLRSFAHTSHSRILLNCSVVPLTAHLIRTIVPIATHLICTMVPLATHLICTRNRVYFFPCSEYTKHLYVLFEQSECTVEVSVSIKILSYSTILYKYGRV